MCVVLSKPVVKCVCVLFCFKGLFDNDDLLDSLFDDESK